MEFRLLGPVQVWADDRQVSLGGHKPRAVLAALLLGEGRVVTAAKLVDAVWGEDPPETARAVIQTYVSGLRRTLAQAGLPGLITSNATGYVMNVSPAAVDRNVFDRLVAEGRRAVAAGLHRQGLQEFRDGLALWHGPALGGIGESFLRSEAAQLEESRVAVIEDRIAVELALGGADQLVGELTSLIGHYPTRERLRCHLMVTLYRTGRQAEALAAYREARQVLIEEFGVEPGPELAGVHESILRSDDSRLLPKESVTVTTAQVPRIVPAQLPPALAGFAGRGSECSELEALLSADADESRACVITGPGGMGKSTLAVQIAHRLAERYPDGRLYVDLRGMTANPAQPEEVLGQFLRALGTAPAELPSAMEERTALYRSLLVGRRMLIVLDNAAAETQIRPLLPADPRSAVVITSRNRLAGLAGAAVVELALLSPDEALTMLGRITGTERVEDDPEAARMLIEQCGHLPLAIRIAGARLATRRRWPLRLLADRLADERRRLDELKVGDQEVRASIELSYRGLDPRGKVALRRAGLLGLPDFPARIMAAALETTLDEAEEILEGLVDAQLVDFSGVDGLGDIRYRLHDLIRLFAAERAEAEETPDDRVAVLTRVLEQWLWLIERSGRSSSSWAASRERRPGAPPLDAEAAAAILANPRAWFEAEQTALVVGVERAAAMNLHELAGELASALCGSAFAANNLFEAWTRTHTAALAAARRASDSRAEARLLAEWGQLRYEQDRYAESREYFSQALTMFREAGDPDGESAALVMLGTACREQGYLPEALHFLARAELLSGDDMLLGNAKRLIGYVHLERGDYDAAWASITDALAIYRKIGSARGEALAQRTASLFHRARGEAVLAEETGRLALEGFRHVGDRLLESYACRTWAKALLRLGRHAEAERALDEVLVVSRELGDRWGEALTLRTLGELHLAAGRLDDARRHLAESLGRWTALDLPLHRARTLRDLAGVHRADGDEAGARDLLAEAREIFCRYGSRECAELPGL
ncbi:BTAD domain-containing putative transcriptional regulator [Nonomuraea sp. NPDC050556]|uniref:AfsR/SARP family transcriptional regulator n=1 Tax=Nonomuraea sp. NPDC050556 TaxID=3364369 RepID=UPI0037978157